MGTQDQSNPGQQGLEVGKERRKEPICIPVPRTPKQGTVLIRCIYALQWAILAAMAVLPVTLCPPVVHV